jgi:DeoR family fructose operon transcriptional repressor
VKSSKSTIQKRQDLIMRYLQEHQEAEVLTLAQLLDVSEITIRRDLDSITRKGLIERYFGGVRLLQKEAAAGEASQTIPADVAEDIKEILAARAAELINDKDVVFINSSATAMRVIKYIKARAVVIVTNNARMISQPHDPGLELILTGGEVYGNKQSLIGEFALSTLAKIKATKCIIGVSGISTRGGITSEVLPETAINQMMLKRCNGIKIVVTDGSKIGRERNFLSGSLTDVTHLITDDSADAAELAIFRAKGLQVTVIENPNP